MKYGDHTIYDIGPILPCAGPVPQLALFFPPTTRSACALYSRYARQYPRKAPQAPELPTLAHPGNPTTVYRISAIPVRPRVCCAGCSPTPSLQKGMSRPRAEPHRFPSLTLRSRSSATDSTCNSSSTELNAENKRASANCGNFCDAGRAIVTGHTLSFSSLCCPHHSHVHRPVNMALTHASFIFDIAPRG